MKKDTIEFILKAIMTVVWLVAMYYLWGTNERWLKTCLIAAPFGIKSFKL